MLEGRGEGEGGGCEGGVRPAAPQAGHTAVIIRVLPRQREHDK